MHGLEILSLTGGNSVADVSALARLTQLQGLGLGGNQVSDVAPLSKMANLLWLNLGENGVSDIGPISGLEALEWLNLYRNPLDADAFEMHIPQMRERGVFVHY